MKELDTAKKVFYYAYKNNIYNEELSKLILEFKDKRYIKLYITHSKGIDKDYFLDFILSDDDPRYIYNVWFDNDEFVSKSLMFIKRLVSLNSKKYVGLLLYNLQIVKGIYIDECIKLEKKYFELNDVHEIDDMIKMSFEKSRSQYNIDSTGFSPKCYKGHDGQIPCLIVCHISSMYEKILYNFYDKEMEVSSHFVIGKNGEIKQVVSLEDSAWCNGTSLNEESDVYYKLATNKYVKSNKMNANYFTYSIEHESMDGSLTEEEYKSTIKVMKQIIDYLKEKYDYDFIIDDEHIIGHNAVNPIVRTKCPGPKFPFNRIINDLREYYNKKI